MNSKPIHQLRREIDAIDRALLRLWSRRLKIAREIGKRKRAQMLPMKDVGRERQVLMRAVKAGKALNLPRSKARHLMNIIIASSRQTQKR